MAEEITFGKWEIKINGTTLAVDTTDFLFNLELEDIPGKLPGWYHAFAEAQLEAEQVQTHYRQWYGKFAADALKRDPKLAEWKIKVKSQNDPSFWGYKEALAQAHRNVTLIQGMIEGLKTKARL